MGLVLGGLAPIVVAGAMVSVRDVVAPTNVALTLVVVVVLVALVGGRSAGVVAALTAALAFDFFHTRPFLSLTIDSQDDIEASILLLVVGLSVGSIAARGRSARADVASARDEIRRVHRLAERTAAGESSSAVIALAQDELTDLLHLESCRFEAPPYSSALPVLDRAGSVDLRRHRFQRDGFELPEGGLELPVLARGQKVGRFVLVPRPGIGVGLERRVVAVALADQVGGALRGVPAGGRAHA